MEIKFTKPLFFTGKEILQFIMRTFIFLFCTTVFSFSPGTIFSQHTKITIAADKTVTIDEIFELISKQSEYVFVYQADLFKNTPKVRLKKGVIKASKLLEESFSAKEFSVELIGTNTIGITQKTVDEVPQDPIRVTGKVTDEAGVPLSGVTVRISETNRGVATNFDGDYALIVPGSESVLVFSSIGYAAKEIVVGDQTVIDAVMQEAVSELDEVVLNAGYYNVTERTKTGSIAKVEAKTIEKQPVNNPLAAMQGQMAGVNIRQTTGVPGGGFEIDIRGKNFINGSTDPLFIVDGVPYGSESLESIVGQVIRGNASPLNAIPPGDIASIEVLKDADATAIYGSRGANGVVLITTKKGKAGKTKVAATISTTLGRVSNFLELMNTEQYLEVRREGVVNDGRGDFLENPAFDFIWPDVKTWDQNSFTDWQEELIGGTAYRNNAQLSVSGGSEQTQFLISGNYLKETTVFPGDSNYKKGSLLSNINHQSNDRRFKINLSTTYTIEDNQLPQNDFTFISQRLAPNAPVLYDDEGNLNWEDSTWDNPLASLEEKYRSQINTLIANTVISYRLLPNLELKTNLGYTNNQLQSNRIFPSTAKRPSLGLDASSSSFQINSSSRQSWIVEPQLNLQQKWGDFQLNILAGTTFQNQTSESLVQTATGFSSNSLLLNLSAAETLEVFQEIDSEYNYQAFFGRVNFNWKDKYILNLTGRRDGSSRFGPGRQFGNFGAVGAAWLFSEENFLRDNTVFSFGKLRGSYGTTGSDNIGDYRFLNTYNTTAFDYDGTAALEPTGIFNPLFAWQENKKLEAGMELGFFKDRVLLKTGWFQNRSSNQLGNLPLAATAGFNGLTGNFDATVENTGFEVDLRTNNLRSENFTWSTTFNLTVPKNKLLEYEGLESSVDANRYRLGEPLTIVNLYDALGVDTETGLYTFTDYNEDGVISGLDDKQVFEDLAPQFYGGLGNTFTYGNFQLDAFFQVKKQNAFNNLRGGALTGIAVNRPVGFFDRWQEPGDIAPIQVASAFGVFPGAGIAQRNQTESNAAVSDASFIRVRNISLTYNLPKINDMDISVYLQGQNLFTITNFEGADPEQTSNSALPPLQQITLGLQLGF